MASHHHYQLRRSEFNHVGGYRRRKRRRTTCIPAQLVGTAESYHAKVMGDTDHNHLLGREQDYHTQYLNEKRMYDYFKLARGSTPKSVYANTNEDYEDYFTLPPEYWNDPDSFYKNEHEGEETLFFTFPLSTTRGLRALENIDESFDYLHNAKWPDDVHRYPWPKRAPLEWAVIRSNIRTAVFTITRQGVLWGSWDTQIKVIFAEWVVPGANNILAMECSYPTEIVHWVWSWSDLQWNPDHTHEYQTPYSPWTTPNNDFGVIQEQVSDGAGNTIWRSRIIAVIDWGPADEFIPPKSWPYHSGWNQTIPAYYEGKNAYLYLVFIPNMSYINYIHQYNGDVAP